ncbi:GNAT family N-acetyltransferase [Zwartia sp.]|uniref:GNAT family N-acetyltransferase n=1 Tax=Zwartia sp. TaxID=2978004 RepID=UPI003BAF31E9
MNTIEHNVTGKCFELKLEGHRCVLDYTLNNQVMTVTHTGVPSELGGRGLAAEITKFALDYAQAQGWKVVPQCSYVAAYIKKHSEYAPLVN